jgi:hypothetical protein
MCLLKNCYEGSKALQASRGMCCDHSVFIFQKKFCCSTLTWSLILSRITLHADKRISYSLLTYLMLPVTQPAWLQERRTGRYSGSTASKWISENSNWELDCKMCECKNLHCKCTRSHSKMCRRNFTDYIMVIMESNSVLYGVRFLYFAFNNITVLIATVARWLSYFTALEIGNRQFNWCTELKEVVGRTKKNHSSRQFILVFVIASDDAQNDKFYFSFLSCCGDTKAQCLYTHRPYIVHVQERWVAGMNRTSQSSSFFAEGIGRCIYWNGPQV